jgi:hypothetical protein
MKKFITTNSQSEQLILSYKDSSPDKYIYVSLDALGLSFTINDILSSFYNFSKLFDQGQTRKIIIHSRICSGYLPKEEDLYEVEKYTKNFSNTLDDIYQFLYKYRVETDKISIYNFLQQKYPNIELYCNSLGYLIMVIENIINTKKVLNILRKCGFHLVDDNGKVVDVETTLKKILKRYRNNI